MKECKCVCLSVWLSVWGCMSDIMRVWTTEGLLYLKTTLHVSLAASAVCGELATAHHPPACDMLMEDRAPTGAPQLFDVWNDVIQRDLKSSEGVNPPSLLAYSHYLPVGEKVLPLFLFHKLTTVYPPLWQQSVQTFTKSSFEWIHTLVLQQRAEWVYAYSWALWMNCIWLFLPFPLFAQSCSSSE